jgi:hypothetical protein
MRRRVLFAAFVMPLLAMPAWAQQPSVDDAVSNYESVTHQSFPGVTSDWSSSHLVYSAPAPGSNAEDAVQKDPRYWLQQIRRSMQATGALDATDSVAGLSAKKSKKSKNDQKSSMKGLWSVNLGSGATVGDEMFPATFTAGTSPSCTNDFVVYNTSLTGSSAVAATGTGTFSINTSVAGDTVTINGVTLTATGVGTDTINAEPGVESTTAIDGVTYIWHSLGACLTAPCVVRTGSTTTDASNLTAAINNTCSSIAQCLVLSANPGATATTNGSIVVVTNTTGGSISWSATMPNQTLSPPSSITAASNTGSNFALSANTTTAAANLATAINNNPTTDVTATSSAGMVDVTAITPGAAGNSITTADTLVGFAWGGATLAGGSGGAAAAVVGFNNIYSTTCSGTVPNTNWAFSTGGQVVTSPVMSANGQKIAYVQTVGGVANLVVLTWAAGSGTITAPTSLTSNGSYPSCTAPCMISIPFSGGANDTNSSPYYITDGGSEDTLFVGDDSGKLHMFTSVFTGIPTEDTTSPWPVTVASGTPMSSPVADGNTFIVFVGDAAGNIHAVSLAGVVTTAALGGVITDGPLVDVTLPKVFWFSSIAGTSGSPITNNVEQTSESLGSPEEITLSGDINAPYTGAMHSGAFDDTYFSSPASGFLYICAVANNHQNRPSLYRIGFGAGGEMNTTTDSGPQPFVNANATQNECSPITEVFNGSTDYFFAGVQADGNLTGCNGACLYDFGIVNQIFPANASAGIASAGGSSGVVIDNTFAAAGASQVYFTPLANQTCITGGTGGCATQASQAGLN